ncbi:MAG: carbohydrate ABC transporter permease [Treponema sp.]|jgi:putative aldouronate transport system permease protein|nr:carbohydrate ABC transporter permease [Treponema sp.]
MAWRKQSLEDNLFDLVVFALSLVIFAIMAYPMWFVIIASISDAQAVNAGEVWLWPARLSFYGYQRVFYNSRIWVGYRNTIFYTIVDAGLSLCFTMPAAYALSRRDLVGRKAITLFLLFTVYFSGGMIPTYLAVRSYGLVNTIWALVIPFGVEWSHLIVSRAYFAANVPNELMDAARVDGCSNTRFFLQIVLPLSKAIVAVIALYNVVEQWNSWMQYMIYVRDERLVPLQMVLRDILLIGGDVNAALDMEEALWYAETMKYSLILVATLPVMCIYPFLQKHFTKGVMVGAIKG